MTDCATGQCIVTPSMPAACQNTGNDQRGRSCRALHCLGIPLLNKLTRDAVVIEIRLPLFRSSPHGPKAADRDGFVGFYRQPCSPAPTR